MRLYQSFKACESDYYFEGTGKHWPYPYATSISGQMILLIHDDFLLGNADQKENTNELGSDMTT